MINVAPSAEYILASIRKACKDYVAPEVTTTKLKTGNQTAFKCYGSVLFYFVENSNGIYLKCPADIKVNEFYPSATQYKDGSWKAVINLSFDFDTFIRVMAEECNDIYSTTFVSTFGCCSDFIGCSDALKCLHTDDPFYRGCGYRRTLENGRVFYGKNKTI